MLVAEQESGPVTAQQLRWHCASLVICPTRPLSYSDNNHCLILPSYLSFALLYVNVKEMMLNIKQNSLILVWSSNLASCNLRVFPNLEVSKHPAVDWGKWQISMNDQYSDIYFAASFKFLLPSSRNFLRKNFVNFCTSINDIVFSSLVVRFYLETRPKIERWSNSLLTWLELIKAVFLMILKYEIAKKVNTLIDILAFDIFIISSLSIV